MLKKSLITLSKAYRAPLSTFYSYPSAFFASENKEVAPKAQQPEKKKDIQVYADGQLITRNHLVLKKSEDIDAYVIKTVRNYFRTTNKQGLTLDSTLIDHGLDSLDSIEISMQIEEDLGYVISAETLPVLQKVKHYSNYIKHIEAYKEESKHAPLP